MPRALITLAALSAAFALPAVNASGGAGASVAQPTRSGALTPCSRLKRLHKPLPPRCRRKKASLPLAGVVTNQIAVGRDAGPIAVGFGSLWVRNQSDGTVSRVDPATNQVIATIPVGRGVGRISVGEGAIWTANFGDGTVSRIDPDTNQVVATLTPGTPGTDTGLFGVATTPGAVWIGAHHAGQLYRLDPQTNAVVASITVGPAGAGGPSGIEISQGALWVNVPNISAVVRIDPATNAVVATITMPCTGEEGTADEAAVWVALGGCVSAGIDRIDPQTNAIAATVQNNLGGQTQAAATGLGSIWAVIFPDRLVRIDPQTNRVVASLRLPQATSGNADVAIAGSEVWVSDYNQLLRLRPTP
jgi:virginiamycin B lyase